ncbi:MAG: spore coat protein [Clostridiales bacterium]|uniref:spore coat protein n=1 Tax=Clostridium sp. N3C TaxID=1776758 RepID=UPI00092E06ED|nr:spore coat protein [Clostridium sp. N3C]NLZ49183.1 spore coat protein [Clostridiales bacterium]SCN25117.1 Spore coat protein [Clostridium sp. N3C]
MSNEVTDKDISLDLLISSKATITAMAKAITEATNPELRELLRNQLIASLNSHYRLIDISIAKGWYTADSAPEAQLKENLSMVSQVTQ